MQFVLYSLYSIFVSILALKPTDSQNYVPTFRNNRSLPLVINTWAFTEANAAAWRVLNHHGNALDALVEGCATCERLQCDGTVGYGGSPDENGETTLDAMIMDGSNMNIGAVAGLRQVKNVISVARHVLEHTKHTLLVGDAASNFAEAMGFRRESLTTNKSKDIWTKWRHQFCQPNYWVNVYPDPTKNCGPYSPISWEINDQVKSTRYEYQIGRWNHDTIGMIVIDANGQIYAGTSTNGASHKIPGRVGDSPIPGAGAYADNEIGAAVATGDGDVMMRFLPALIAVEGLRAGNNPSVAAEIAMQRIVRHYPDFSGGLVVVNRMGNYGAACVGMSKFPYSIVNGDAKQNTRVEYKYCKEIPKFL
ncbi:putative N(4)-(beta-N-acetylglucosaminyl)-L-asparaginase GA14866 [Anastrepha ludens]|uniref:putative N(4)-(beta-N-acetylglucosaminyl)-L-asparaginase GA14866 n=1 Tax=Anastrepha ludens TaxID=28586 RepID=UPI0023B02D3F|nr:putative N(4)-(beta-N-acetylglucosaminyl)-L-asparaginase GA14866 [Anastrepha ludens]